MGVGLKQSWGILGHSGGGFGGLGVVLARFWAGLVTPWGCRGHESSYGHFLELILSLRPGVLMKGFFITFGLCNGGSGGQRRGAAWRDVARRRVRKTGSKIVPRGPHPMKRTP